MMLRFQFEFPQHHAPGFDASSPVSESGLATTAHLEDTVGSGSDSDCFVFDNLGVAPPETSWLPGPDYLLRIIRPRLMVPMPLDLPVWPFFGFWVLHFTRIFRSPDYAVFVVFRDELPVHYTAVVPKYFRYPLMEPSDLLLGSIWTKPGHRGRSIARSVVAAILRTYSGRRCWYLTRTENLASMSIASASKLRPIGRASRSSRFGLRLLGSFRLSQKDKRCPL